MLSIRGASIPNIETGGIGGWQADHVLPNAEVNRCLRVRNRVSFALSGRALQVMVSIPVIAVLLLVVACTGGQDAVVAGPHLSVLTLNLHGYEESRIVGVDDSELTEGQVLQRIKRHSMFFDGIAAALVEIKPDIICLQEVAEWPAGGRDRSRTSNFGASKSNMVQQILLRLDGRPYTYTMDWSHYAWDAWMEGSAILSRYPIVRSESRYVSRPENSRPDFWKSRKVSMAAVEVPGAGPVNVYSVHLGWWDDEQEPFREQFDRLQTWIRSVPETTTILCGDFNVPAASEGYEYLIATGYIDTYATANPGGVSDATVNAFADGWDSQDHGQRIDYVLTNTDGRLQVLRARLVFTPNDYGRVSDHVGVYVELGVPSSK